jgi:ankyrin repeat protein
MSDAQLRRLMDAIVDGKGAARLVTPALANASLGAGATRASPRASFYESIRHYVYAGDTALHVAAAAHRDGIARALIDAGADLHARNRRKQTPLHYAVDGRDPKQVATMEVLLSAGADPNAIDGGGVTPLHRAVRNRCAAAVRVLLERGADPRRKNKSGSTAFDLGRLNTGKSGSGSPVAKEQQRIILGLLAAHERTRS